MITKLQVKYIQSLGQKKFRDEEAVFVAEGPKIINELLGGLPDGLLTLYATRLWLDKQSALLKKIDSDKIIELKEQELERISFLQTPHEVLAVFKKPVAGKVQFSNQVSLMLDGIQDPGNMGTLIRIADWFGVKNILCSMDCADAFSPKVVQASMGSIARVQVFYTDLIELAKENSTVPLYAAAFNGENIHEMNPLKEGIVVIGNEGKGIHATLLNLCRHKITIPRIGQAESLNAGVAAGIILSHLIGRN